MLHVHPTRIPDLLEPDILEANAGVVKDMYRDGFGNICSRLGAPAGELHLHGTTLIEDTGEPDATGKGAEECPVAKLPTETLQFLLASRYCEVDLLSPIAHELFGGIEPGWPRVQAICGLGDTGKLSSAISSRGRPRRRWMYIPSGEAYAATSSTWRSPFAGP